MPNESRTDKRVTARRAGRESKVWGDLLLMSGSINDAMAHINYARDEHRKTSDSIWLASTIETTVCATIFSEILQTNVYTYSEPLAKQLMDAINLYYKAKDYRLYTEASFRLARYLIDTGFRAEGLKMMT
jgi:hypothetical protein